MRASSRAVLAAAGLLVGTAACSFPTRMEPATPAPGGHCPLPNGPSVAERPPSDSDLRWYRAADPRDVELAARWCSTVGAAVLQLVPREGGVEWRPGDALQVISWNMWIGGGDLLRFLSYELGVDCSVGGRGVSGTKPFVLLLQEVWRYSADLPEVEGSRIIPFTIDPDRAQGESPDIVEAAKRCGLALAYVPSARNGPDDGLRPHEDKGNAVLSNLPLADPIAFDLPLEGGRKVAVAATLAMPEGRTIRVVALHLDVASTLLRTLLTGNQTRLRQAMGLVDGLARAAADGLAVDATVVGADMNTWASNESAFRRMLQAFPGSPPWDGRATRSGFPTDHIFFRVESDASIGVIGYARIENRYGSDHHARRLYVVSRSATR
ncbi:MAG: hypothetical protein PVJ80_06295 [Gemmatimonadota bacterium]